MSDVHSLRMLGHDLALTRGAWLDLLHELRDDSDLAARVSALLAREPDEVRVAWRVGDRVVHRKHGWTGTIQHVGYFDIVVAWDDGPQYAYTRASDLRREVERRPA